MKKKIRSIGFAAVILLWALLAGLAWFGPKQATSLWERRPLQQMPDLTTDSILGGGFMEKFEDYTLDQFPARNAFRTLKSLFSYNILQMQDNNGIYIEDGYAAKIEYPLSSASLSHAIKKQNYIYENYLKDTGSRVFMTVIPDKGYYLAQPNGYPALDYNLLIQRMQTGMPWATYVDITDTLSITDYYRTDTHWRQEKITAAAEKLCHKLEIPVANLTPTLATNQFYGVYYGQAALPMGAEDLYWMEGEGLSACRVYNYETKQYGSIYDTQKLSGADPYETYLSGSQMLLTIENPNATTDRELILFRDSFGSSLAPYFAAGYKTVTLVDIRYIGTQMLDDYLTFRGQDVLFAYSTLILNNSSTMK